MKSITNLSKKETPNKGITLIALVITIIVLLILAGVSIATLTGENGILNKATIATEKTKQEEGKEAILLAIDEMLAEKLQNGEKLTIAYIGDHIHEKLEIEKEDVTKNGEPTETVDVIYGDYEYEIDLNFNVTILGKTKQMIKIEYTYEKQEEQGIIHLKIKTEDKDGIKKVTKPDGTVQEYSNNEKEVTIDYIVKQNGKYKFIAEGYNGNKRAKTINVEELDYFNVSFDTTIDFLTIENAYNKSKEPLTNEEQQIVSDTMNLSSDTTIYNAKKPENSNMWTLFGQSKNKAIDNMYFYDKYDVVTKTVYEEGEWSEWSKVSSSVNTEGGFYENYSFDKTTGDYTSYGKTKDLKYADFGAIMYGPNFSNINTMPDSINAGKTLTQYRNAKFETEHAGFKNYYRTKSVIEKTSIDKGTWKEEIISNTGIYPDDASYKVENDTYWYKKKEQVKAYYIYKYANKELQTSYDIQNNIITTKKIDLGKRRDSVKILIQADNINYRISISKDNQNWIEIGDKSVLNGKTDIKLPEECDSLYIKIERSNSNVSKMVVKE